MKLPKIEAATLNRLESIGKTLLWGGVEGDRF